MERKFCDKIGEDCMLRSSRVCTGYVLENNVMELCSQESGCEEVYREIKTRKKRKGRMRSRF